MYKYIIKNILFFIIIFKNLFYVLNNQPLTSLPMIFTILARSFWYSSFAKYWFSKSVQLIEALITPWVNTGDAVDQERQGINGIGFGQLVAAKEAI